MGLTKRRLKAMRKLTKQKGVRSARRERHQGGLYDATGKGMICEGCGEKTHRMVWRDHLFYCKSCYDAGKIRKRQEELFKGMD